MIETFLVITCLSSIVFITIVTKNGCSTRDKPAKPPNIPQPIRVVDSEVEFEFNNECAICLEDVMNSDNDEIYVLNCNHVYHEKCILEWFQKSKKFQCPLCLQ